jgi:hypothetical protein
MTKILYMNNCFKNLFAWLIFVFCLTILNSKTLGQGPKTFISGSYIVDMGQHSGTLATDKAKELTPWGMIYDLLKNYNVPVYVVINANKTKDGIDFNYNGINYKGGTFVIDKQNISTTVSARITYWNNQGMVGTYTNSNLTLNTTFRYTVVPTWTLDQDNYALVTPFFTNAKIPSTAYNTLLPSQLSACNDIFVLPHADPTWAVHGNLFNWNLQYKGAIWTGCHSGSALHNTYNPANTNQQMNFLTTKTLTAGTNITLPSANSTNYSQNSLQIWGNHSNPTAPYNTCNGNIASGSIANGADPVAQYIGTTDASHGNGSERSYVPAKNQTWLPSTKIICYDASSPNVPSISNGPDVLIAYGRAFGDSNRGLVMMESGHDLNKGTTGDVAAQRAFWNWSFLAAQDKAIKINSLSGLPINNIVLSSGTYNLSLNYSTAGSANSNLTFSWSCIQTNNSLSFGTFTPNGNSNSFNTTFSPTIVNSPTDVIIQVVVTDGCGRQSFESFPVTIVPNLVTISGKVWNDTDRSANNTFNNIYTTGEQGTNANNTLLAYCLDQNGFVIAKSAIFSNGDYSLGNIPSMTNGLSLILSTLNVSIGTYSPTPIINTLGWINTSPLIRSSINTLSVDLTNMDWGVDAFPIAVNDTIIAITNNNLIYNGDVSLNDYQSLDGGNTWTLISGPDSGSIVFNIDGSFTYTAPYIGFIYSDTFYYKLCDVDNDCSSAMVVLFVDAGATVPITLSSFNARLANNETSVLSWNTQSEINANRYEIERSENAINFTKRGNVTAIGSPTRSQDYTYNDALNTSASKVYYRLKMIENDGSYKYSSVVTLKLKDAGTTINTYPNPFASNIKIDIVSQIEEVGHVKLIAIDGRVVTQFDVKLTKGNNAIQINSLESLPKATYTVEVSSATKKLTKRVVKK